MGPLGHGAQPGLVRGGYCSRSITRAPGHGSPPPQTAAHRLSLIRIPDLLAFGESAKVSVHTTGEVSVESPPAKVISEAAVKSRTVRSEGSWAFPKTVFWDFFLIKRIFQFQKSK